MRNVIGQERAIGVLRTAMAGRMHHAWVLHGPVGVGKFTAAIGVARQLLCHDPQTTLTGEREACGACASCKLFAKPQAAHPDLHVVTKELAQFHEDKTIRDRKLITIPVDIIRQHLIEPAHRSAAMAHNKVFILDEAELMRDEGQNALLKTLEEPPAGTYIFLITAHEDRLFPTILSRCQRVGFAPLSDEQVMPCVDRWSSSPGHSEEDIEQRSKVAALSRDQREGVVRFACGSPGRAVLAGIYGLDEWHRTLVPMVANAAAGKADPLLGAAMADRCAALAEAWVDAHDGASKEAANKMAMRLMLSMLGEVCRSSMRKLADAGLTPEAADAALGPWLAGVELLGDAEAEMAANVAPALLLDNLAIQWAQAGAAARLQPA